MRITTLAFLLSGLLISACSSDSSMQTKGDDFEGAYPEMYSSLELPEYRKGTLQSVTGKNEGQKTEHTIIINTNESPRVIGSYFSENMEKLGWRDTKPRKQLSDISLDDLFIATYVKGKSRFHVNAATTPDGSTKMRISLSVFGN